MINDTSAKPHAVTPHAATPHAPEAAEAALIESAVEQLGIDGYAVCTGLLPLALATSLLAEQLRREAGGALTTAGVGRSGIAEASATRQRAAQSSWFAGSPDQSAAEQLFLAFAERLRLAINRRLMLGLFDFEAQFLHYPTGGFYRRHIDALQGERSRVVSLVAYLNVDWTTADGGTLAIWPAASNGEPPGEPVVEVAPLAGTVVLMLSEEIPHEARVALRDRRAIAGWFRITAPPI
jgi:SM-20-related protein